MITLQMTAFSTTGKYRPMSTLVQVESMEYYKAHAKEVQRRAVQKICAQRYISWSWMKQYGYTRMKIREYDKEKIEREKRERYEQIKRERGWIK